MSIGAPNGPQTGAQGVDTRAVIRDAISTTLNRGGYWLPAEARAAVADAIANLPIYGTTEWRRLATKAAITSSHLGQTVDAVTTMASETVDNQGDWGDGYRAAQEDLRQILNTLQQPTA